MRRRSKRAGYVICGIFRQGGTTTKVTRNQYGRVVSSRIVYRQPGTGCGSTVCETRTMCPACGRVL